MPLSPDRIEEFRRQLIAMRSQILRSVKDANSEIKTPDDVSGYSQHQADQGTDDFDRTIQLEISDKEQQVLKQIQRALEKIEEHSYGVCDVSGKEIPEARLKVLPYTNVTVQVQQQMEKGLL